MYRNNPFRSTLNRNVIKGLGLCFKYAPRQPIRSKRLEHERYHRFGHYYYRVRTEATHSVALNLNTNVNPGLSMCKVCTEAVSSIDFEHEHCTEAVHSVAL